MCNLMLRKLVSVYTFLVFPCLSFISSTTIAKMHVLNIIDSYRKSL